MTLLANNDPNHLQLGLNVIQNENNWIPNLELFTALSNGFTPVVHINMFTNSRTHVTITYNKTGHGHPYP